uniref:Uncharacterized protein n=1 Tax=Daphnia galeata TaxID=27404 RepID=A0A8J2S3Z4_9CRUS|nr:unnamed protein product [Daphnia galeata]
MMKNWKTLTTHFSGKKAALKMDQFLNLGLELSSSIEPIPISADSLLHSSYHAADDLLITGGKEVRTYGVDVTILDMSKCKSSSIETPEKQMKCFIDHSTENDYIEADSSTEILTSYPMEFKVFLLPRLQVVVSDGVVCAINPGRPGQILWKYKFESPVVHVWKLIEGNLTPLDLFNPNFVPALESQPDIALTPFRVRWQHLTAKTSLVGYQGRFTTSTAVSNEDKEEASTKEHIEENNDPKITAMIVRHQTDYPYGEQVTEEDQLVKIKMLPILKKKKKS